MAKKKTGRPKKKANAALNLRGCLTNHCRALLYCGFSARAVHFYQGVFMNTVLLVAFGLVAVGSIIRLVLFFTAPKDRADKDIPASTH